MTIHKITIDDVEFQCSDLQRVFLHWVLIDGQATMHAYIAPNLVTSFMLADQDNRSKTFYAGDLMQVFEALKNSETNAFDRGNIIQ